MNERIRELAEQANGPNPFYGTLKNQMTLLGDDAVEKFAELIVQECVKVVDDMADPEDSERYFWAIQNASQKIKDHFGVEQVLPK